jgi:hypothetical protein
MDAERKTTTDDDATRLEQESLERTNDAQDAQPDVTNLDAVREASRLGGGDTYLVKTDLEDKDEREDVDQPDGRASPMANADNPER